MLGSKKPFSLVSQNYDFVFTGLLKNEAEGKRKGEKEGGKVKRSELTLNVQKEFHSFSKRQSNQGNLVLKRLSK